MSVLNVLAPMVLYYTSLMKKGEGRGWNGDSPTNTFFDILFIIILSKLVVNGWTCQQKSLGEVNKES